MADLSVKTGKAVRVALGRKGSCSWEVCSGTCFIRTSVIDCFGSVRWVIAVVVVVIDDDDDGDEEEDDDVDEDEDEEDGHINTHVPVETD